MKKYLSVLLTTLTLFSCQKEDFTSDIGNNPIKKSNLTMRKNENDKPDVQTQIVLGKQLKNPYSVKNMQAAFDYYNEIISDSKFKDKVVKPTNLYIKIIPKSVEDLEKLDNLDKESEDFTPVLQDYPMDYEIITEGDYYVYPKSEEDLFYPAYTVIPVGYQLPEGITYEVLDELYQPKDEEYDIETISMFFADWKEDLEVDDIFLTTDNLPEYLIKSNAEAVKSGLTLGNFMARRKFTPDGYVKVQNTATNVYDPLMQAEISYGRSLWWHYTYTDDNGYFSASHSYRGKVRIRAKWRGYTATIRKTWNEVLGLWVSDHLMTVSRNNNGITKYIEYNEPHTGIFGIDLEGGHLWYKGTIHNGLRKYIDYCNNNGISNTISYANVWAWAKGKDASTPMLYKYRQLATLSSVANMGQADFWHVMVNSISSIIINILPSHLRPDQIYAGLRPRANEGTTSNTIRIHQTVFHESGHYSHASKAGDWFWAQVFASEISNQFVNGDPYSDGSMPSYQAADRIALAEGWGNLTEFKIAQYYYGKAKIYSPYANYISGTLSTNITSTFENFNQIETPISITTYDDKHWFMHGIMWDLLDNNIDGTASIRRYGNGSPATQLIDNAFIGNPNNQFDLTPIYDRLESNINNQSNLRNALITAYPNQASQIRILFSSYYDPL
ncbi:hypothetical protein Q361_1483 [Flavobacterium croceum DSM 17960]|uniref:Uncharacterized protein n=1 Tax=Flavobacterium croceum DSM 17960 TaxID=1121886 RepID=A0A2S4N4D2_9FLAO|nr:hypothetical protein [Flavobacterium croceum]POS00599.1 hypothetical protein Q361_1483 [Flavobacterium croceum DSM 17960]